MSLTNEHAGVILSATEKTVEAEIKAAMPPQRVREAESRVGNKPSNGPLRAQGKSRDRGEYSATCGHTSVAGDMQVSRKGGITAAKQGGTAEKFFAPDGRQLLSGVFSLSGGNIYAV